MTTVLALVLSLVYWLLALALLPFFGLMALVTISAFLGGRRRSSRVDPKAATATAADAAGSLRLLVVIPAHNEEANVGATVASCLDSAYDPSRFHVCVIADNCTDDTAFQARQAGAEVFERTNETRRSKGYALEDFFETRRTQSFPEFVSSEGKHSPPLRRGGRGGSRLARSIGRSRRRPPSIPLLKGGRNSGNPTQTHTSEKIRRSQGQGGDANPYDFDAVIVIDADTVIDRGLLSSIARALGEGSDWIQCYYTVRNPDASWRTRLLTYAFSLFNGVWLLGQDRLGLGSGFRGNGMAFSARGLARVPWKAYGLVEDQEFSWMLRVAGERVRFLPDARVYGEMVTRGKSAVSQRKRWEEGRSSLRSKFFRPILNSQALSLPHKLLDLLDLFMLPLMPLLAAFLLAATAIFWLPWTTARIAAPDASSRLHGSCLPCLRNQSIFTYRTSFPLSCQFSDDSVLRGMEAGHEVPRRARRRGCGRSGRRRRRGGLIGWIYDRAHSRPGRMTHSRKPPAPARPGRNSGRRF